jgi:hypothetical protein
MELGQRVMVGGKRCRGLPSPGLPGGAVNPYTLEWGVSAGAGGERTGQPDPARVYGGDVFPTCSFWEDRQEKAALRATV